MSHSSEQHVFASVAGVLEAPALKALWARHYVSRRDENPFAEIVSALHSGGGDPETDPALFAFISALVRIERGALGAPRKNETPDIQSLRQELDVLSSHVNTLADKALLPSREDLPQAYRMVLDMLDKETAQVPFRPLSSVLGMMKETAHHVYEDAKEHPKSFTGLVAVSLGALGFMNMRMGSSATLYIDPEATTLTNLSLDALDNPDLTLTTDSAFLNMDLGPSCHDHLRQILGDTMAGFVKDTLDTAGLFPQHCSKLKTLAVDAQGSLQSGYDFINTRIGFFIKDPATDLGNRLLPDSPFKEAFNTAAHHTAEFIYGFNTVENVVLHTLIFASAMATTVKLGTLETNEGRALRRKAHDFLHRSALNNPLTYAFGIAASAQSYVSDGINPEMIWMGLGGALAGQIAHRSWRRFNGQNHVRSMTISAREALGKLAGSGEIVSDVCAGDILEVPRKKSWRDYVRVPVIAAAGGGALTAVDFAITGGQGTGAALGFFGVALPFLAYNVPEDAGLHIIFGIAGGAAGTMRSAGVHGRRALKQLFSLRKKCEASEDVLVSPQKPNGPS